MIRLTCTQCKSVLEMDDAFAGGVCRCQHCGTIQTVPSHLKGSAVAAPAKSLYQGAGAGKTGTGTRGDGTGLYDLADAVASSGLSRSSLKDKPASTFERIEPTKAAPPPNRTPLLIGAGAVIVILLGVVLWLAFGNKTSEATNPNPTNQPAPPPPEVNPPPGTPVAPPAPVVPHFFSIPIDANDANKIVYVIDRSDSAKQTLDMVKAAMFNSIESLGANREFAVVFWAKSGEKDMKQWSFPDKGLAHATPQQLESVRERFADLQAFGSSDVSAAMKQAYGLKPEMIFLVTAKGIDLDDSFARGVDSARKNSNAKVYTIDLANGEGKKFLEPVANKSHGKYTPLSPFDLKPD
jgi:hypothetical protein